MRTLKEQMEIDVAVFLNPNEFGENMLVDGVECLGLWDEEVQPVKQFLSDVDTLGVFNISRVLFLIPKNPEGALPVPEPFQELEIDGQLWAVRDVQLEAGIIKLTIFHNVS